MGKPHKFTKINKPNPRYKARLPLVADETFLAGGVK